MTWRTDSEVVVLPSSRCVKIVSKTSESLGLSGIEDTIFSGDSCEFSAFEGPNASVRAGFLWTL